MHTIVFYEVKLKKFFTYRSGFYSGELSVAADINVFDCRNTDHDISSTWSTAAMAGEELVSDGGFGL